MPSSFSFQRALGQQTNVGQPQSNTPNIRENLSGNLSQIQAANNTAPTNSSDINASLLTAPAQLDRLASVEITRGELSDWLLSDDKYPEMNDTEILIRCDFGKRLIERQPEVEDTEATNTSDQGGPTSADDEKPVSIPGAEGSPTQNLTQSSLNILADLIHSFEPKSIEPGALEEIEVMNIKRPNTEGKTLETVAQDLGLNQISSLLNALSEPLPTNQGIALQELNSDQLVALARAIELPALDDMLSGLEQLQSSISQLGMLNTLQTLTQTEDLTPIIEPLWRTTQASAADWRENAIINIAIGLGLVESQTNSDSDSE